MASEPLFLDTSFAVALAAPSDEHHARATELSLWIEAQRKPLLTTTAVLLEIGSHLAQRRFRAIAESLLHYLTTDPRVRVVPLSESLYDRGARLFFDRPDKEWSLTDCISFVVMEEHGLYEALTADHHFRQAGFRTLLQN